MPSNIADFFGLDKEEVFYTLEMFGGDLYYQVTYGDLDYLAVEIVFWVSFLTLMVYLATYNIFEPAEKFVPEDDGITPYPGDMIV